MQPAGRHYIISAMSHSVAKKITIRGWQAVSPVLPHPIDLPDFHSPFGKDNTVVTVIKKRQKPPATGWCSWYAFGQKITQEKILTNARWIASHQKELPLEYIVIDDGYCPCWGDWQIADPKKFPRGLKPVADEIKTLGLKPGIWMAPFVADLDSQIYKNHPDWFLKDSRGRLVYSRNAAQLPHFILHHAYLLDFQNPEVEKFLYQSVDIFLGDYGFELFKIDFAASLYFDPRLKTPEMPDRILKNLLSYIRRQYPHVYILIGVAPIEPILGLADSTRISSDIIFPQVDGLWPLNKIAHTLSLIQLGENLPVRKNLAEVIAIDPDAMVCRQSLGFSEEQISHLLTIIRETPNGLKFLGDDLPNLPWDRVQKFILPLFAT